MIADRHAGKTAVVTGAASGIGRGIARRLGEEGATVVVADVRRSPKQADRYGPADDRPTDVLLSEETAGAGHYVETDVSDPDAAAALVEATVERTGRLDVLVNNAGIHVPGDSQALSIEEWREVRGVNLDGAFYCAKYAIPHLREAAGSIVNVASVNAVEGGAGPPYASAKGGMVNLTRDLAVELGGAGVRVNAVCPGFVETPIQDYLTDEEIDEQLEHTLLPRGGLPEDVGDAVVFLASDEAEFITGEALFVDGGWTAHSI